MNNLPGWNQLSYNERMAYTQMQKSKPKKVFKPEVPRDLLYSCVCECGTIKDKKYKYCYGCHMKGKK